MGVRQRWQAILGHPTKFENKLGTLLEVNRATVGRWASKDTWPPYVIALLEVLETVPEKHLPASIKARLKSARSFADMRRAS